ncbi:MAG: sensor histidine kinase, partial [Desulfobacteraceae bacterium]
MNSTTSSKSLSRVPLQIILIVPFILLVITAAGLVGYLSLRNGQKAINNVAHELRMEINTRITEHVRFFLGTPHRINQVNATAIGNGTVAADDPNALENRFLEQIRLFDTVTSIYFGNTSGGLADAGREGPAGSMYVIETDGFVKGHFRKYATDSNGKRAGLLATVPDFDSRTRSWYRGAVKKNGAFWSNVYILFTGQDIAISASCPVYDTQQKLIGVVAADIFLSHLSSFLKELDIGRNGQSFIMEHSGMLIASSTDEQPFTVANKASGNRRLEAGQSSVSLIRGSAEALINKFGDYKNISTEQYLEFDFENKRQFLQVSPLHDPYGLNWLIVTVIPESDFMAQIDANKRSTIMLIVIAMMIAVALGIFLSRGITRPVWRLNASTRKMAMGDWDHTVKEDERIQEIAELTLSFNSMARQLKEMFSGLTNEIAEREKAERQLRESEEKYRTLHETMVQGVVYQDEKGRILSANPSAERILGLSVDQMQGITSL